MARSSALHMRARRERLRAGIQVVQLHIPAAGIARLIQSGLLGETEMTDRLAIAQAIARLLQGTATLPDVSVVNGTAALPPASGAHGVTAAPVPGVASDYRAPDEPSAPRQPRAPWFSGGRWHCDGDAVWPAGGSGGGA